MHPVIIYSSVFFAIGGIITWFTTRKRSRETKAKSWTKFLVYLFIVCLLLYALLVNDKSRFIIATVVILIGLLELIRLFIITGKKKKNITTLILSLAIYLPISWGFYQQMELFNSNQLVFIFFVVFAFDGFSQIVGQLLGKHKILPYISPGKTVEGFLGGLIFGLLAGLAIAGHSGIAWDRAIVAGLLFGIGAFIGDLLASWNKRSYGVKDYSNIIPGHGGILDRFDSWLLSGALAYFTADLLRFF